MKFDGISRNILGIATLALAGLVCIVAGTASLYRAQLTGRCAGAPVQTDTFIKTYRMRDRALGFGMLPTKDGGYLLTGDTTWSSGMGVWNAFVIKTDAKGVAAWSKQFGPMSAAQGVQTETERLSAQTSDGNYVVAGDMIDFYDAAYEERKELWGDVMVTKLNASGNWMWSTMVGDYSMDFPQRLWATPDGGTILLAKFKNTGYEGEIADFDAVSEYSVAIKFDAKGSVQWSKKLGWTVVDMEYLPDGGFVALAAIDTRISSQTTAGAEGATSAIPTIIRMDGALTVLWAKSIEAPSLEYAVPTGTTRETMRIRKAKIRVPGGDFTSVEQAPDGGFIAFGRYFNAAQFVGGNANAVIKSPTDPIPSVAVKVDAQGTYLWAKSVKTAFGALDLDLQAVQTADKEFILSRNVARKANFTNISDMASTVELMKVDANFNPRWVRKIDIERDAAGYHLRATRDGGAVLAGRVITEEQHMVMGSLEPYQEALLVKTDANGNVSGARVVTESAQAEVADQSSLLIMQTMSVGATADMQLPVKKTVKPAVTNIEDKQRTIVPHANKSVTPLCSLLNAGTAGTASAGRGAVPQASTYPQIRYESVKEAKIETEKSRQIHEELLPILKKVVGDRVKMTDNTGGLWLTYYFPRQATVADREAMQKEYVALGYKVDEAEGGVLNVSKVGRSLRMTFSVNNSMVGKLEVML
ncbi:MAG: hypothetical protein WCV62_00985 [Candidatus Peribacteraceae bacterium]|jgi:hypothetical protein